MPRAMPWKRYMVASVVTMAGMLSLVTRKLLNQPQARPASIAHTTARKPFEVDA
jgi:hypothetical protein